MSDCLFNTAEYTAAMVPVANFVPSFYNMISGGIKIAEINRARALLNQTVDSLGKQALDKQANVEVWKIVRGVFELVPLVGLACYGVVVVAHQLFSCCCPCGTNTESTSTLNDPLAKKTRVEAILNDTAPDKVGESILGQISSYIQKVETIEQFLNDEVHRQIEQPNATLVFDVDWLEKQKTILETSNLKESKLPLMIASIYNNPEDGEIRTEEEKRFYSAFLEEVKTIRLQWLEKRPNRDYWENHPPMETFIKNTVNEKIKALNSAITTYENLTPKFQQTIDHIGNGKLIPDGAEREKGWTFSDLNSDVWGNVVPYLENFSDQRALAIAMSSLKTGHDSHRMGPDAWKLIKEHATSLNFLKEDFSNKPLSSKLCFRVLTEYDIAKKLAMKNDSEIKNLGIMVDLIVKFARGWGRYNGAGPYMVTAKFSPSEIQTLCDHPPFHTLTVAVTWQQGWEQNPRLLLPLAKELENLERKECLRPVKYKISRGRRSEVSLSDMGIIESEEVKAKYTHPNFTPE